MTRSNSASGTAANWPYTPLPAQLIHTSGIPSAAATSAAARRRAAPSATSAAAVAARPPAARTSAAAAAKPAGPRAISPTAQPRRANSAAVQRPMPELPPVMTTTGTGRVGRSAEAAKGGTGRAGRMKPTMPSRAPGLKPGRAGLHARRPPFTNPVATNPMATNRGGDDGDAAT